MQDPAPGLILGGYQLDEEVARGGMGAIYRAHHVELRSEVAVKVLKRDLASRAENIKRFLREGKLIARLDHPGIVRVFDVGRQGDFYYLVMDFISGRNLQQVVDADGPMPPEAALRIALQVADALGHAHDNGVVHRDIKPSNLLLSDDGSVHVTDFGIARLLEQETAITRAGALIGTPSHMSPEQCRGSTVDQRSDLYSLGATLYTLLSGKPPFSSRSTARLVNQLLNEKPLPIESVVPDLPPPVAALVKRLMAKHPGARYQTAKEARNAIDEILQGLGRPAPRGTERSPSIESTPNSLVPTFILTCCALIGGIVLLLVWLEARETEASAREWIEDASATPNAVNAVGTARQDRRENAGGIAVSRRQPGNDSKTAPTRAHSARTRRVALTRRIEAFQKAVVAGNTKELYRYLDPAVRNSPNLLISLGKVIQSVDGLGPNPTLGHTLTMDEHRADVFFEFCKKSSKYSIKFPATWRLKGVTWYLQTRR